MIVLFLIVVSSGVGGRGELSLAEVQCHLDKEGASDLVIDLIMNATSDRIFQESILLAIALLEGGNPVIQVSRGHWVQEFREGNEVQCSHIQLPVKSDLNIGCCSEFQKGNVLSDAVVGRILFIAVNK